LAEKIRATPITKSAILVTATSVSPSVGIIEVVRSEPAEPRLLIKRRMKRIRYAIESERTVQLISLRRKFRPATTAPARVAKSAPPERIEANELGLDSVDMFWIVE